MRSEMLHHWCVTAGQAPRSGQSLTLTAATLADATAEFDRITSPTTADNISFHRLMASMTPRIPRTKATFYYCLVAIWQSTWLPIKLHTIISDLNAAIRAEATLPLQPPPTHGSHPGGQPAPNGGAPIKTDTETRWLAVMVGNDPNSTDPMWDAIIPPKDTTGWTRARRSALATIKEASAITPAPTNHPRPTRIEDIALWYAIHSTARTQWMHPNQDPDTHALTKAATAAVIEHTTNR